MAPKLIIVVSDLHERHTFMSGLDSSTDSADNQIYFIQPSVKEMPSATAYRTDVTTEMDKKSLMRGRVWFLLSISTFSYHFKRTVLGNRGKLSRSISKFISNITINNVIL